MLGPSHCIGNGEYLVGLSCNLLGSFDLQSGPASAKLLVSVQIQCDCIPAGIVHYVYCDGIILVGSGRCRRGGAVVEVEGISGVDDHDELGIGVQEEVEGAVLGQTDVLSILHRLELLSESCECSTEVGAPVGILAELEVVAGSEHQAPCGMPGAVCHHGLVAVPVVARGGDASDDAPGGCLGELLPGISAAAEVVNRYLLHIVDGGNHIDVVDLVSEGHDRLGRSCDLLAASVVVEDEVLGVASRLGLVYVEVPQGCAACIEGAADRNSGPAASEVVDIAVHVQRHIRPADLVDGIDTVGPGMIRKDDLAGRLDGLEVLGPSVDIDVGPFTGADCGRMGDVLVERGALQTLLHGVECESVPERPSTLEGVGVDVDSPLLGYDVGMAHQVGGVAYCLLTSVEVSDNVDLLVHRGSLGHDDLQKELAALGAEGLPLVVEDNLLLVVAGGKRRHCDKGKR